MFICSTFKEWVRLNLINDLSNEFTEVKCHLGNENSDY